VGKKQFFQVYQLPNGITLLGEEMDFVSSAAFSILVPMGAATDPEGQEGAATILAEMYNKGAGPWGSRELSQQFEDIGVQRSHNAGIEVSMFSGAMLGENLLKALELYSQVLLEPHLPGEELDSVKQLALQDLKALEDEPASKVMSELAREFYPYPFGRSQLGTEEGVKAVTIDALREHYREYLVPNNALIAVAGKFDWEAVKALIDSCFGNWRGKKERLTVGAFSRENKTYHLQRETSQLQIALAYPSVSFEHPDYYVAKVAVSVLSGGMAGRLFVEVREKRGLVYRISASHSAARNRAAIFASAGTTPENGEKTLSVMLDELTRVARDISDDELGRAKADLKSRLIMQSELSSVRCAALVNDWWNMGRLRTLEEIKTGIDAVTAEDIARHVKHHPVSPITLATLGPKKLEFPL
jgi:predicted Zn-dependent peptidase